MDKSEYIALNEDVKQLLNEFLLTSSYGVIGLIGEVTDTISKSVVKGRQRMKKLLEQIDNEFPEGTTQRALFDGVTYHLFTNAYQLYYIGNNAALFVELQGILERVCINKICVLLSVGKDVEPIMFDAFSMKTLKDIAEYFHKLNIWDKDDVTFAERLTNIRNGLAHKNATKVSKLLGNGKDKSLHSITEVTNKSNMIPYIIQTTELVVKVSECMTPNTIKNPRFKARFEEYSKILGPILNLYGEMLIDGSQKLPDVVKDVMLKRFFAPSILLGSKDLGELLIEYKDKVIQYHRALIDKDDNSVYSLHPQLSDLVDKIIEAMKNDLNIDADTDFFVKPEVATVKQVKEYLMQKMNKTTNSN